MATDVAAVSSTTSAALMKREDCKRIQHGAAFSKWKILTEPNDWGDYLMSNKDGAETYRTRNLPDCFSCPGVYEFGIPIFSPESGRWRMIPVYLGKADNIRARIQQYGRNGAHLENGGCSNAESYCKGAGLFSDILSRGFPIAYRWAPMKNEYDAEKKESELLNKYDFAWNKGMNGKRRPTDIHRKLDQVLSRPPLAAINKLQIFGPQEVSPRIKDCDLPTFEIVSTFSTKLEAGDMDILPAIFKFSRSRPIFVCKESDANDPERQGMSVKAFAGPLFLSGPKSVLRVTCGVTLESSGRFHNADIGTICGVDLANGTFCTRKPVTGRKRCEEHKGMRVDGNTPNFIGDGIPSVFADSETRVPRITSTDSSSSCGAITADGSICKRKPGKDSNFCWQHEARKAITNRSSCGKSTSAFDNSSATFVDYVNNPYQKSDSLTSCGAITADGSPCRRNPGKDGIFCWQHETKKASNSVTSFSVLRDYISTPYQSTCGSITADGSACRRNAGKGGRYCWQHEGMSANACRSSWGSSSSYRSSPSQSYAYASICGAMTRKGTPCSRRTRGGQRCHQH